MKCPPNFVQELKASIACLEDAIKAHAEKKGIQITATASIESTMEKAMDAMYRLDGMGAEQDQKELRLASGMGCRAPHCERAGLKDSRRSACSSGYECFGSRSVSLSARRDNVLYIQIQRDQVQGSNRCLTVLSTVSIVVGCAWGQISNRARLVENSAKQNSGCFFDAKI